METLVKFVRPKFDLVNYTHVIQIRDKNLPICLEEKDYEDFWNCVGQCDEVKVKERFQSECPVIVQIDKGRSDITLEQKRKIVASLQFSVMNTFKVEEDPLLLTTIHEQDEQITVVMPHCKVPYNSLRKEIRDALIYILDQKKIISDEGHNTLVNKTVYNTPFWISRPVEELEFYPAIDGENIQTIQPLTYQQAIESSLIDGEQFEANQASLNLLLSFTGYQRPLLERNITSSQLRKALTHSELIAERVKEKVKSDLEIVLEIKQFLDKSRCNTLSGFLEIGQCLFNISGGDQKGLLIWKEIASETENEDLCEKYWPTFEKSGTTIGTFRYWCSQDDSEGYKQWQESNLRHAMWMCLNPTAGHADIANVMYRMYQDRFLCASIKDQIWFEFRGHKYEELDGGVSLRILLSTDVAEKFESILNDCNINEQNAPDGVEKNKWQQKQERCLKIIVGLKCSAYKTNIMREASEKFYDSLFIKQMNMNKKLFVLENGVLDCERIRLGTNPDSWIRPGRPEDKTTFSCGNSYKSYTWDHPDIKFCQDYLRKVFVDEAIRNYFVRLTASCLEGGNKEKIAPIFTGTGNNSKSVVELILEKVFGDYCAKPPSALLTASQRTAPGSATPEYEVLRYSRICFFQEPKAGSVINDSVLKELSSGFDSIYSRALNKMPQKIVPQFTPIIVCNRIPRTDGSDPAVINRIRVVEFLSRFSREFPDDEITQWEKRIFPIDLDFESKIPLMVQPFLWILIQEYAKYKDEGLPTPKEVELATLIYKESNDVFSQFLEDKIEIVEDPDSRKTSFVRMDNAYQAYKLWYRDSFPGSNPPSKADFKEDMRRHGYPHQNLRFFGIKIRQS